MLLFLADAVEYGEWKLGKRNESVSFAIQPFINQFGSAISKGVVSITLIISGINAIANSVAAADGNHTLQQQLREATPGSAVWIMKISMMILPLICILVGFIIYSRKFKIDEKMYEKILADLEERAKAEERGEENGSAVCDSPEFGEIGAECAAAVGDVGKTAEETV